MHSHRVWWTIGVATLAACGTAPAPPTLAQVTYTLSASSQIVIDTVSIRNPFGDFITFTGPASPFSKSIEFEIPGLVEAQAHLVAIGAGTAKLLAVWSVDGVVQRDSAMASPAAAEEFDLTIPRHIVSTPGDH